jgi:hypothetical protein
MKYFTDLLVIEEIGLFGTINGNPVPERVRDFFANDGETAMPIADEDTISYPHGQGE